MCSDVLVIYPSPFVFIRFIGCCFFFFFVDVGASFSFFVSSAA